MPRQSVADLLSEAGQERPSYRRCCLPPGAPSRGGRPAAPAPPKAPPVPAGHPAASGPARTGIPHCRSDRVTGCQVEGPGAQGTPAAGRPLDELAKLRRMLNRQRAGDGERITENTLIRVAVDMLLSRTDRLRGTTEDQLRKSVTP